MAPLTKTAVAASKIIVRNIYAIPFRKLFHIQHSPDSPASLLSTQAVAGAEPKRCPGWIYRGIGKPLPQPPDRYPLSTSRYSLAPRHLAERGKFGSNIFFT